MMRHDLTFDSSGTRCAAYWYVPNGTGQRPLVVMGHGLGGTRELGLDPIARAFCDAGLCVLVFDYRHYGASAGEPRELLSIRRQRADFRAALAFARTRPEACPERAALWGYSFAGGHVMTLAAEDLRLRAAVAHFPFSSGAAAARTVPAGAALRINARALHDLAAAAPGRGPVYMPLLGKRTRVGGAARRGPQLARRAYRLSRPALRLRD